MKLTEKEKKILTILHEARLVNGKLLKDYEKQIKRYLSFSNKELHQAIKKFLEIGLLEKIKLKNNEVMYIHTKKVSKEMINPELFKIGYQLY